MGWKEVKLSGNLLTDDSVGMLDGLIGLEVLEDYDKSMVQKIKNKRPKRKAGPTAADGETAPAKKKKKKQQQKKAGKM